MEEGEKRMDGREGGRDGRRKGWKEEEVIGRRRGWGEGRDGAEEGIGRRKG